MKIATLSIFLPIESGQIEKEKKDRVQKGDIAGLALEQKLEIAEGDLLEVVKV